MVMQKDTYTILRDVGVFKEGHFAITSGRHSGVYVNKDAIFAYTAQISELCRRIAILASPDTQVVAGRAIGGVVISQWVAYHLNDRLATEVLSVYAETGPNDTAIFNRGYRELVTRKRVLVVEDVLTSGRTARSVVDAVRMLMGEVVGVSALVNRGSATTKELGSVPRLHSLVNLHIDSWDASQCPLCKRGVPINTEIGKGAAFLAANTP